MALTYVDAGVDQTKKDKAIDRILEMMRRTHDKGVIDLPWGFAGLYSLVSSPVLKKKMKHPVQKPKTRLTAANATTSRANPQPTTPAPTASATRATTSTAAPMPWAKRCGAGSSAR